MNTSALFEGKGSLSKDIYDRLIAVAELLGPVQQDPKQTCIHLNRRSAFAGVYVRNGYLLVEVKTDYPIDDPMVRKSQQLSRKRFHHQFRLDSPQQADSIAGWLKDAYALSG